MKTKRKIILVLLISMVVISGAAIYQNCGGTHTRSTDFSISYAQAQANFQSVQCAASGSSAQATALTDLGNLIDSEDSDFFYTEAPSAMGDLSLVAPLDYSSLRTDGGGTPQQIYAFFAVGPDGTGALVIALSDGRSGAAATPSAQVATTPASALAAQVAKGRMLSFNVGHRLVGASNAPSCNSSSSNPLNLTQAITSYNDGSLGLEPASYDGDIFEMELTLDGSTTLRIRSYDVDGGSLQDTIQLEINQLDNSGQEIYLGDLNMTRPD